MRTSDCVAGILACLFPLLGGFDTPLICDKIAPNEEFQGTSEYTAKTVRNNTFFATLNTGCIVLQHLF